MFCVTERWVSFATTLLRCNRRKLNTCVHNERDVIIVLQSPRDQHVDYSAGLITVQSNSPAVRGKAEGKLQQRHDSSGSFANNNGVSVESREQITRAAFQKLYFSTDTFAEHATIS